jgi:tight adherence protein C
VVLILLASIALLGLAATATLSALTATRGRTEARVREVAGYGYGATAPVSAGATVGLGFPERLGQLVSKRLKTADDSTVRTLLLAGGLYRLTPGALLGYRILACAGGAALGLTTDPFVPTTGDFTAGPVFDTLFLGAVGWVVPMTLVRRRARLRIEQIDRALPDAIDLVVVAVEAGQGFVQALTIAAERAHGPLGDELRLTLHEQQFGLAMDRALENLAARIDSRQIQTFVRSVVQGERLGVSIGQVMRNVAREMRTARRQRAEEAAQKTMVKILFPLVFLIMPALIIVLLAPAILDLRDTLGI